MLTNETCRILCATTTFSTYHYSIDMHPRLQANLHQNRNRRLWRTPESKNGRSNGFLMLSCVIGSFITSFSGRDTATYVRVGNRQKTSRMPKRWSTSFTERTRRSRGGNERQQLSFGTRKRRKWVEFRDLGAGKGISWTISFASLCFTSFLIGPARYKWPWHGFYHLRITVKWRWSFAVRRIRSIIVRIVLSCFLPCMKICSPGGLRIEKGIM
jgi:hypothetical protein